MLKIRTVQLVTTTLIGTKISRTYNIVPIRVNGKNTNGTRPNRFMTIIFTARANLTMVWVYSNTIVQFTQVLGLRFVYLGVGGAHPREKRREVMFELSRGEPAMCNERIPALNFS